MGNSWFSAVALYLILHSVLFLKIRIDFIFILIITGFLINYGNSIRTTYQILH